MDFILKTNKKKQKTGKQKRCHVMTVFHFAWFCCHWYFPVLHFSLWDKKQKYYTRKLQKIAFYFQTFSVQKVCHGYHVSLCHNLHEPSGRPQAVLTLDYVAHASVTRFSLSIDVYCSTCLSVLWIKTNVTECTHSNFVKCAYHLCLSVHTNIYSVR